MEETKPYRFVSEFAAVVEARRLARAMGMATTAAFTAAKNIVRIEETDMLEENGQIVSLEKLRFRPFEIKTFLLHL